MPLHGCYIQTKGILHPNRALHPLSSVPCRFCFCAPLLSSRSPCSLLRFSSKACKDIQNSTRIEKEKNSTSLPLLSIMRVQMRGILFCLVAVSFVAANVPPKSQEYLERQRSRPNLKKQMRPIPTFVMYESQRPIAPFLSSSPIQFCELLGTHVHVQHLCMSLFDEVVDPFLLSRLLILVRIYSTRC